MLFLDYICIEDRHSVRSVLFLAQLVPINGEHVQPVFKMGKIDSRQVRVVDVKINFMKMRKMNAFPVCYPVIDVPQLQTVLILSVIQISAVIIILHYI